MELPDDVRVILDRIDSSRQAISEFAVGGELARVNLTEPSTNLKKSLLAERIAFDLDPQGYQDSVWGAFYGPLASFQDEHGMWRHKPDISSIDSDVLAHWQARSTSAKHPCLRARYADLVWDLSQAATGVKPDAQFARIAIDAYVEVTDDELHWDVLQGTQYLRRALQLGLSINDKGRIQIAKDRMLAFSERHEETNSGKLCTFLFDNLLDSEKHLAISTQEASKIIGQLECLLSTACETGEGSDPWHAQAIADCLSQYYRRLGSTSDVHRVTELYGRAFEEKAIHASPLLALAWLQPVYDRYRDLGMKEDAQRVLVSMNRIGGEVSKCMVPITVQEKISTEELDAFLDSMTEGGIIDTIRRIAVNFIPKIDELLVRMEALDEKYPLNRLFSRTVIDHGQHVAVIGAFDEDSQGRVVHFLAQDLTFRSQFLVWSFDSMVKKYSPGAEVIVDFLYQSPAFYSEQKQLLLEGIKAYLVADNVKCVHVSIPQIEASCRHLLSLLGVPTNKPNRASRGTTQLKNLNDVLGDPDLGSRLGKDLVLYLSTLLVDQRGQNLRNRVSHGMTSAEMLNRPVAAQILHAVLTLGLIRKVSD